MFYGIVLITYLVELFSTRATSSARKWLGQGQRDPLLDRFNLHQSARTRACGHSTSPGLSIPPSVQAPRAVTRPSRYRITQLAQTRPPLHAAGAPFNYYTTPADLFRILLTVAQAGTRIRSTVHKQFGA